VIPALGVWYLWLYKNRGWWEPADAMFVGCFSDPEWLAATERCALRPWCPT
jgi:hypothetical protein